MLQTSGLFLSAHADRPVISTGTPHVTASQTNISAPRWQSRRQVPEKEKKAWACCTGLGSRTGRDSNSRRGSPSHAFEACSLDRSDTYPCCQNGNLFIMPHSADLANRSFAELDSAWDNAILCEIAMGQTMSRLTVRIGQLRKSEFFNYQNPNIGGGRSGDGATLH